MMGDDDWNLFRSLRDKLATVDTLKASVGSYKLGRSEGHSKEIAHVAVATGIARDRQHKVSLQEGVNSGFAQGLKSAQMQSATAYNEGDYHGYRRGAAEWWRKGTAVGAVGLAAGALSLKYTGRAASRAWESLPSREALGTDQLGTYFPSLKEALQTQYEDESKPLSGKKTTKAQTLHEPKKAQLVQSVAQPMYTPAPTYSGGGRTYSGGETGTDLSLIHI